MAVRQDFVEESKLYSVSDLNWRRDSWLRLYRPMSTRELDAVLTDWKIGLGKLPYLKVLKEEQTYGFNQLVHIRCLSKLPKPNLSIAKADIQRIWRTKVGDGIESGHTFKDTEKGFEFHFVGLSKAATALSGVLVVESNPPRDR